MQWWWIYVIIFKLPISLHLNPLEQSKQKRWKNDKKQEDPPGQPWTSSGLLTYLLILDLPFKVTSCISPIKGNGNSTIAPSVYYILQCAILFSATYQQCTNKWTVQIKVIKVIWYLEVIVRVKKWSFSKQLFCNTILNIVKNQKTPESLK